MGSNGTTTLRLGRRLAGLVACTAVISGGYIAEAASEPAIATANSDRFAPDGSSTDGNLAVCANVSLPADEISIVVIGDSVSRSLTAAPGATGAASNSLILGGMPGTGGTPSAEPLIISGLPFENT
jgi:hypothetical protein